ncbi:serine protease inhibitor A3N [Cricetulus griseus]|uniref:Serine protease inhibitor A3N n=1 Tax=Cricetulus griseus TaxID=10029 RepID=A0A061I3C1_CRIGR|nr:serine protease inhibitor A3N [Cricetulus griseus]
MALLVTLGLLMVGIYPAVLCQQDSSLGRNTEFQEDWKNGTKVDSLTLASMNTDFAFSLYKELALKNPDKNIVFSPFSISFALAFLSLGASSNTMEEILEGLKFNLTETPEADIHRGFGHLLHMLSQPEDQVQISTGSAIFVEKHLRILAEFKEKARALYQAEASLADFQQPHETKKLINDYVSKQTQGKIKELISDLDIQTVMVLVNYIFFKGEDGHYFRVDGKDVGWVVHKAVLDVAETGTEAAAATGVSISFRSRKWLPMTVYLDRPFLMIVFDTNTQIALFMAKITNPKRG